MITLALYSALPKAPGRRLINLIAPSFSVGERLNRLES